MVFVFWCEFLFFYVLVFGVGFGSGYWFKSGDWYCDC